MPPDDTHNRQPGHPIPHPKRKYEQHQQHRRLKDVDSAARVRTLKTLLYSLPGGVAGALGGGFAGFGVIPGFVVGFLVVFFVTKAVVEGAGTAAGGIYHPSGRSSPIRHEYSYAESLAARGRYEEALTAYEVGVSEYPEDPEPYLRIARIKRDKLEDFEEAAFWFKRARSDASISKGQELLVTQELIEVYRDKLKTPARAIPELARIVDRFPDDRAAEWARGELNHLKEVVRAELDERAG